jgi:hypothetical protein
MGELALGTGSKKKKTRLLGALTGAGLVLAVLGGYLLVHLLFGGGAGASPQAAPETAPPLVSEAGLEQRNGVRITHVSVSGGGGLVDLRYQVVDPDKAAAVHGSVPELVDETTHAVANKPFMGHTHTGKFHAGRTYFVLFENPGNLVQRGTRVTVVLGGLRVPHVDVE